MQISDNSDLHARYQETDRGLFRWAASYNRRTAMADLSRVQEKIETLASKVEDLMSRQPAMGDDGQTQSQVDQLESRLDEILARFPA